MNQCQFVKVKYKYVFHKTKSCNDLCYDRRFKTLSIATHSQPFAIKLFTLVTTTNATFSTLELVLN